MVIITRLTAVKILELVLMFVLIPLDWNSYSYGEYTHRLFVIGTFGGYFIILVILFVGALLRTPENRTVELIFTSVGCILFFIAGLMTILVIANAPFIFDLNTGIYYTKAVVAFIQAVLLLIDAIFTFRREP